MVHVLALGTFLMGTTEFVVAGLLPEIAGDLQVSVARTGLMITVFAVGMIVGAPLTAMLTLRLPKRLTLMLVLGVFAAGHVIVALSSNFTLVLAARFLTAIATGAFWAVANVAAARARAPQRVPAPSVSSGPEPCSPTSSAYRSARSPVSSWAGADRSGPSQPWPRRPSPSSHARLATTAVTRRRCRSARS